jgi:hypothetical protein
VHENSVDRSVFVRSLLVTAALLIGALSAGIFTGVQWPFAALVVLIAVFALGQYLTWTLALAGGLLAFMSLLAMAMPIFPALHLGLEASNLLLLSLVGLASWLTLWGRRGRIRVPSKASGLLFVSAIIVPVLGLAYIVFTIIRHGADHLSWAMSNDAVWNTVSARFFVTDGGLVPSVHPNPGPFTNELMASAMAPGRSRVPIPDLLLHDLSREVELWLFLTLLASFLSGFVVARAVRESKKVLRIIAGIGGGLIPLTWYATGFSFMFGFMNVTVAIVVLLCIWLLWAEVQTRRFAALCFLILATTVMLAVWAPLACIPAAVAAASAALQWRDWRKVAAWPATLYFWLAVAQLVAYVLLLTIPDLRRDGAALGGGGAMVPISPTNVMVCAAITFVLTALAAIGRGDHHSFVGVCILIGAGGFAIAYLSGQSAAMGGWGYYAAKLSWMLTILALILVAASIIGWVNEDRARLPMSVAVVGASVAILVIMAGQMPPAAWGVRSVFPELTIGRPGGMSARDAEAATLFSISDPRKKSLVVGYFADPAADQFVNGWLIQQPAQQSKDPFRNYAYYLDTSKPDQVCDVIHAWGGGVDVYTRNATVKSTLAAACPNTDFRVIVRR